MTRIQRPFRPVLSLLVGLACTAAGADEAAPYRPPVVHVPDGFIAELVAAPPLVQHPLMAGFDERGRLFIAESAGKNLKRADLEKELPNFVRMIEDTDGDGVFDKSTIFADKMTMPQGALWHRGALYVCSSGGLWRLEDTDDDGVADVRKMIVGGFGYTGNAADIHGPFLSPTGRLYWCDGRHGHEFVDAEGKVTSKGKAARIFSCRPDGSDVQTHCGGGMDNPVELDFMPTGEILGTVNLFYRQRGDCLVHWVRGGVYPRYDQPDCLAEFPSTGEPLTEVYNYGHVAVSGCMRYRSGEHGFGKEYADNFFVTQFNTHKVVRTVLTRSGGTFTAQTHEFLSSPSTDFHPTDVLEDADGSLLVIDTGGWFRIGCPTSQIAKPNIHGAIWRIRRKDAKGIDDPRGRKIEWDKTGSEKLIGLLGDDRFCVRQRAGEELASRGADAEGPLSSALRRSDETIRRSAVWGLSRLDTQFAWGILPSLVFGSEKIRRGHGNESVLRATESAAEAAGKLDGEHPAMLFSWSDFDRVTEHKYIYRMIQWNDFDAVSELLRAKDLRLRRGALIALDQMPSSRLTLQEVAPHIDSDDIALRNAALSIIAGHPEWVEGVDVLIAEQLQAESPGDDDVAALRRMLFAFVNTPAVQSVIGKALSRKDLSAPSQRTLLDAIGRVRGRAWPETWHPGVEQALGSGSGDVQFAAVAAIVEAEEASLAEALVKLAENRKASAEVRVAAMAGLAKFGRPPGEEGLSLLLDQLEANDAPARLQAASALGSARLNDEQLRKIAGELPKLGTLELGPLLAAFEQTEVADVGNALVDALKSSPAKAAVPPRRLQELLAKYPVEVRRRAEDLLATSSPDANQQQERLDDLLAGIQSGDAARGRQVFLSRRAACSACHRVGSDGGDIGPDLTRIATRRNARDLVEAIAFPSASLARGFESYTITTGEGKVHTGAIVRQTADTLVLRTTEQTEVRIARSAVDEMVPSPVSVMPQGLDRTLSTAELSDIVAYLQSLGRE